MLLTINDALSVQQKILVRSQEAIIDYSGTIASTGVSQTAIEANSLRSGWVFQNNSLNTIWLNDNGTAAVNVGYQIAPGQMLSTLSNVPLTINAISVLGTASSHYTLREF